MYMSLFLRKNVYVPILGVMLVLGIKEYLGFHYYYRYKSERQAARSIQQAFPRLENYLRLALRFSHQPLFYQEIGRLYLEMAMAENEFGSPASRDDFLLKAEASLKEQIRHNPADARAFYNLGKVYLLYNFPLLTYSEQGCRFLRRALELKPADEFLNINIIFIYLAQWELLTEEDKKFLSRQLKYIEVRSSNFREKLRRRWLENFPSANLLEERLELLASL